MRANKILMALAIGVLCVTFAAAQVARQTGTIRGIVTDNEETPLPGVAVSATGPALMGSISVLTDANGGYRLINLPPGLYTITASLSGFKTVNRPGVVVEVGQSYTLNLRTEVSAVLEEITVSAAAPTVDVQSNKVGNVLSAELLQNLPLGRTLPGIFQTVAGANGTIDTYSGSIHGGASTTTTYEIDGVNNNDPTHNGLLVRPQYDSMAEMEISTGGLPAQVGNTGGSYVNIVTKSGGNTFHGQAQVYYTNKGLSQSLFTAEDLNAWGFGQPVLPKYDLDMSFSLGGPIIKDKLWFFGTIERMGTEYVTSFTTPTFIINGKTYSQYSDPKTEVPFFLKLTTQLSRNLRLFAMVNGSVLNRDVYGGGGSTIAHDATFTLKNNTWVAATTELNWMPGSNTVVAVRAGYVNRWYPITEREEARSLIGYIDSFTGYQYNSINTNESYITRRTLQGSGRVTQFLDEFLGGNHEIGAGIEYQYNFDRYGYARGNPVTQYLYAGDVYVSRRSLGIDHTDPVQGDGRISIAAMAPTAGGGDTTKDLTDYRISGYLQDSFTIKNRLTINLGLRIDHWAGSFGGGTSTGVTDPLALAIGSQLEANGAGYNPFAALSLGAMDDLIDFTTLSPRVGLSFDVFGDAKTALKASFSRYYEPFPVMFMSMAQPGIGSVYPLYWFDLNGNRELDATDKYTPTSGWGEFNKPDLAYLRSRLDPSLKTPDYNEWTASLTHELFKNFSVKVEYINKRGHNDWAWGLLYDQALGQYWNNAGTAPAGFWVPYTTTIPAFGGYAERTVTIYLMTNNAPVDTQFTRMANQPDSVRKYNAIELSFDKRYAGGWALGGSIVYSQLKTDTPYVPNDYTHLNQYDPLDVPLAIKLYGTVGLPWGFVGSFFYQHLGGTPWARWLWINVPSDFIAANNLYDTGAWVQIEDVGAHRNFSTDNIDFRLEKEFDVKLGTLSVFVDVFNLLGNKYVYLGLDPMGVWTPETGQYTDQDFYYGKVTGYSGSRVYKFSVRFAF